MDVTCPIESVTLPGLEALALHGLIVVIGPNSSGKTQLLRDINEGVCGRKREFVVASTVSFREPPPFDDYCDFLVERGTLFESEPDHFLKRSLQFGADRRFWYFPKNAD